MRDLLACLNGSCRDLNKVDNEDNVLRYSNFCLQCVLGQDVLIWGCGFRQRHTAMLSTTAARPFTESGLTAISVSNGKRGMRAE